MNVSSLFRVTALGAALFAAAGVAQAASLTLNPASVTTSTANVPPISIDFTGDGVISLFDAEVKYDQTRLSAVATGANGGNCGANNATGVIVITYADSGPSDIPVGPTTFCNLVFTVVGALPAVGDPAETLALTWQNDLWGDAGGNSIPAGHTLGDGEIVIQSGPPADVIAGSNPADGTTVTFPGGAPGDPSTATVGITVDSGTVGTVDVTSCTIAGADAADFTITAPAAFPATAPVNIVVDATLGAAALSATLTCEGDDSSAGGWSFTWPLTAPAGSVLAGPSVTASPAPGMVTLPTSPGTPVTTPFRFTPGGGDAGGPDATVSCSATAGFTVAPATLTLPVGSAAANVMVGCTPGPAVQAGSVTCVVNDAAGATDLMWEVSCPAAAAAVVPTFVPASSLWSKIALFGLFGALGMLVLGSRRSH